MNHWMKIDKMEIVKSIMFEKYSDINAKLISIGFSNVRIISISMKHCEQSGIR